MPLKAAISTVTAAHVTVAARALAETAPLRARPIAMAALAIDIANASGSADHSLAWTAYSIHAASVDTPSVAHDIDTPAALPVTKTRRSCGTQAATAIVVATHAATSAAALSTAAGTCLHPGWVTHRRPDAVLVPRPDVDREQRDQRLVGLPVDLCRDVELVAAVDAEFGDTSLSVGPVRAQDLKFTGLCTPAH